MRKMRKTFGGIKTIWIMFAVFLILFGMNNMSTDAISAVTSRAWLLVMLWSFILSIMLLIKNRLPFKTSIAIAGIFGGLVLVSYAEVWKTANTGRAIYIIAVAISTFLASMAVFGVFEKVLTTGGNSAARCMDREVVGLLPLNVNIEYFGKLISVTVEVKFVSIVKVVGTCLNDRDDKT